MNQKITFADIDFSLNKNTGIYVSECGTVYSPAKKRILRIQKCKDDYCRIGLSLNGSPRPYFLHRLLAETFIQNPNNYPCVNHIDGDKSNNTLSNLEWCTHKQNTAHAIANGLWNPGVYDHSNRKHSKETKQLMSIKKIGIHHPKHLGIWCTPLGNFESSITAAKANDTYAANIRTKCKSSTPGYSFIPKNNNETSQSSTEQDPKAYPQRKAGSLSNQSRTFT